MPSAIFSWNMPHLFSQRKHTMFFALSPVGVAQLLLQLSCNFSKETIFGWGTVSASFRSQLAAIEYLCPQPTSCGDNNSTHLTMLSWGLNYICHEKYLVQCLAHSKCLLKSNHFKRHRDFKVKQSFPGGHALTHSLSTWFLSSYSVSRVVLIFVGNAKKDYSFPFRTLVMVTLMVRWFIVWQISNE